MDNMLFKHLNTSMKSYDDSWLLEIRRVDLCWPCVDEFGKWCTMSLCVWIMFVHFCKLGPKRCNKYAGETPIAFGPFGQFFPVPKIPSLKLTNCTCKNDGWKMILSFWDPVRFSVSFRKGNLQTLQTIGSMGRTVYLPTWMVDLYGKLVGKDTVRPMDLMGNHLQPFKSWIGSCELFLSGQDTSVDGDMLVRAPYGFTFEEDRQGCHLGEFFRN